MLILYVDNFRGFSDCYIPILDVNFLVGENSTGKTSILSVLCLLSRTSFWFRPDFNTEEVQLGTFKENVSMQTGDPSQFRFGLVNIGESKQWSAFLITFTEESGQAVVHKFDCCRDGLEMNIILSKKMIKYRYSERKLRSINALRKRLDKWTKDVGSKSEFQNL